MPALLDDLKGVPVGRIGGQIDYQGATRVINGGATKAQNIRFLLDTAGTRFGTAVTMSNPETGDDVTGVDCLTVLGQLNPGEVPVVFDSAGNLWQESPSGSGTLVPLTPPVTLPAAAYMGSTKGQNNLYACFRKGNVGKGLALLYNGPGQTLSPISQNPIAAIWIPGRNYLVGDVVRTSQNPSRWFRCIVPGAAGNSEPVWPTLDGYLLTGSHPSTTILSAIFHFGPNQAGFAVTSSVGMSVGDTITVTGVSDSFFNGTWVITGIGTNNIVVSISGAGPHSGTGGILTDTSVSLPSVVPATAADTHVATIVNIVKPLNAPMFVTVLSAIGFSAGDTVTIAGNSNGAFNGNWTIVGVNLSTGLLTITMSPPAQTTGTGGTATAISGTSQWVEWTPGTVQFVPQPEAPEQIISVKGQAGAPAGSIAAAQDVYVCFAYQNANGESQWTTPIIFSNTAASDVLEVFFQKQNEVPGPTVPAVFGAAGYGGPRIPNWLISVLGLSDPTLAWPVLNCLNVYVAAVAHSAAAPTTYSQYLSGAPIYQPVVITAIPAASTGFNPRITPTAAFSKIPFIGQGGSRYFAVERLDVNGSLVPIDPGSPLLANFVSSVVPTSVVNITFIQCSSNIVTCTVDQLAGFAQSAQVIIAGVSDASFNGSFTLTGVSPNQYGGATLIWSQTGTNRASSGGTATSASAASAFVTPQALIATISRATNVVSAVVNSLQGLSTGIAIAVAGVADASFDGSPFVILTITANLGGGGTITWAQTAANASSTGGTITPTGAGVGTNAAQSPSLLQRINNIAGAIFQGPSQPNTPPPGFVIGAVVTVAAVTDASFDGTFTVTAAGPWIGPTPATTNGWFITWSQTGAGARDTTGTGSVTLITGGAPQQGTGNVTAISRAANLVTVTLDSVTNFTVGAQVKVNGVADTSYNGVFFIVSINTGANQLTWNQPGANSSSSGGTVSQTSGGIQQPTPVVILPPGGQFIAQDIAAFTVQGAQQAGPFNYIPAQTPATPFLATIQSIGAVNGTVTALLSTTAGIQPGNTIQVSGTPNGWFDGVFVLAGVNGNTVQWAGVGPGTGFTGGTLTLIPTLPTDALGQNNPLPFTTISRTVAGIVSASLSDVTDIEPGQRVQVSGVPVSSFNGNFIITSVQQFPDILAGVVTWQSATLSAASSSGGNLLGLPGVIVNFSDTQLPSNAEVTSELQSLPAPPAPSDLQFIEQFDMIAYVDNTSYPSAVVFGNPGDPANVAGSSGDPNNPGSNILSVNSNSGTQTVCVREIKDGPVICLKTDGGYQISISAVFPSQWTPTERWDKFGPPCPALVAVGPDFLAFVHETGVYAYVLGQSALVWVTEAISGSGTWSRINWPAMITAGWCAIDDETRELHVGLCLDGSSTVNYKLTASYFGGWEQPEVLNRYGKLITPRNCIKISIDPFLATTAAVLKRTLTAVDSRITGRQMVYGLPGSIILPSGALQNIVIAARVVGTVTLTLPLGGSLTGGTVVVAGVADESFDGTFTGATFSTDGTNDYCTYAQAQPDSNSGGGTVSLGVSALRVVMSVPDRYDDYGNGIDSRYRPWLWQQPPRMLKVGGHRTSIRGHGQAFLTPFTEDPTDSFQPQGVDLPSSGTSVQIERGIRIPDNEFQSYEISNGAVPGNFFIIDHMELCIGEMGTRRG
jgi:hypothetical protein